MAFIYVSEIYTILKASTLCKCGGDINKLKTYEKSVDLLKKTAKNIFTNSWKWRYIKKGKIQAEQLIAKNCQ